MSIASNLRRLDAPRKVVEAGEEIDYRVALRMPVPTSLVEYIQKWYTRNIGNNRYGK